MSQTHQEKRENTRINKIRHEKGGAITDTTEITKNHKITTNKL